MAGSKEGGEMSDQGWCENRDISGPWVPGSACKTYQGYATGEVMEVQDQFPLTYELMAESSIMADLMIMHIMSNETNC